MMIHYYSGDNSYLGYAILRAGGKWENHLPDGRMFGLLRSSWFAARRDATRFFECGIRIVRA